MFAPDQRGDRRRSPSRNPASSSTRPQTYPPPRNTDSPPASAYFATTYGGDNTEPRAIFPDSDSHFAYSTTLRRHPQEVTNTTIPAFQNLAQGNWQKAYDTIAQGPFSRQEPNGNAHANGHPQHASADTPSAKFSQSTIEVTFVTLLIRCR